jgi:predicted DNA-binding transcriptional regulator AlpA
MIVHVPPLPVTAAAQRTGLSVSTLNKLRVFGGGPVFLKLGRRVAYDIADLDAWIASKRRSSTSDDGSRLGE